MPPAGGRNLPQGTDFLRKARERAYPTFSVSQRVSPLRRRPKGFPVALWKPSGPLLRTGLATRNRFLAQGKEPSIFFSAAQKVSPQRRRPGGFPVAPWTPSGACIPCRWAKPATNSSLFVAGKGNAFPAFSCMHKTVLKIQQKEPGAIDRTGLFPCHGTTALTRPCRQSE